MSATHEQAKLLRQERNKESQTKKNGQETEDTDEKEGNKSEIGLAEILIMIVFFALPNDVLDLLQLTGIGYVITVIIDIILGGAVILWTILRVHTLPKKRVAVAFVAELIPGIGMLPGWTIWILYAYAKRKGALPSLKKLKSIATRH